MPLSDDPYEELAGLAGQRAEKAIKILDEATLAYEQGRERDALRVIKPLYDQYSSALGIQELYGMCLYSNGKFKQAKEVLEKFAHASGSFDQHPLLMDCYRAEKNYEKVDQLWADLGAVSPSGAVVAEGRIVHSQSLAERGKIGEALKLLRKKVKPLARPKEYHLRLWYCLADLEERAGNIIVARQWFDRVSKNDPSFADVDYRIKQLS
ncbi:MAG TPA: hypothetical protein PKB15_08570 [Acidimicrobiia bacterium]|nr:hypothetical protein [Acidimicrobiia bacterium]